MESQVSLRLLVNRANHYRTRGKYSVSAALLREALSLAEATFGPSHLEVGKILNNLGVIHKYLARFDEAESLYRRAFDIFVESLGPDHSDVATIYHNLGGLEHARGRYALGEPLARHSVEIRETALGPHDVEVAADLAALAAILDRQKKYDESESLYHRALDIFVNAYGPEHYEVAINLNNLAALSTTNGILPKRSRFTGVHSLLKKSCSGRSIRKSARRSTIWPRYCASREKLMKPCTFSDAPFPFMKRRSRRIIPQ